MQANSKINTLSVVSRLPYYCLKTHIYSLIVYILLYTVCLDGLRIDLLMFATLLYLILFSFNHLLMVIALVYLAIKYLLSNRASGFFRHGPQITKRMLLTSLICYGIFGYIWFAVYLFLSFGVD